MIKEAFGVIWQTLKGTWEELYSLIIVNIVWFFASIGIPVLLLSVETYYIYILGLVVFLICFPISVPGMYCVANRVARGKTFHFDDFIDGIKEHWWRALRWFLANILVALVIWADIQLYPAWLQGTWGIIAGGFFLAVFILWCAMQVYFWPMLIQQEEPKLFRAWRNSALLILANPVYALIVVVFSIILLGISIGLGLIPLVFVGLAIQAILGSNAVLTLLLKFGKIEEFRPKPLTHR